VIPSITDESIDGILLDTYLASVEDEKFYCFPFFKHAYRVLKKGGYLLIFLMKILIFHFSIFNLYKRLDLAISRKKSVRLIRQMNVYTGKAKP